MGQIEPYSSSWPSYRLNSWSVNWKLIVAGRDSHCTWCHFPRIPSGGSQLPTEPRGQWFSAHHYDNTRPLRRWDVHWRRLDGRDQRRRAEARADEVRGLVIYAGDVILLKSWYPQFPDVSEVWHALIYTHSSFLSPVDEFICMTCFAVSELWASLPPRGI